MQSLSRTLAGLPIELPKANEVEEALEWRGTQDGGHVNGYDDWVVTKSAPQRLRRTLRACMARVIIGHRQRVRPGATGLGSRHRSRRAVGRPRQSRDASRREAAGAVRASFRPRSAAAHCDRAGAGPAEAADPSAGPAGSARRPLGCAAGEGRATRKANGADPGAVSGQGMSLPLAQTAVITRGPVRWVLGRPARESH